ncbi:MAG TPA: universal stress protein [Nitrososphaeraceae archaeon]|nr:universal stress protein [Nitrososphaeraceae archaeon]
MSAHNGMTVDKQYARSFNKERANLEPTIESNFAYQNSSIPKENLPSFSKILIADDGKDESNRLLNYAISLSKYSGAELLILRILENMKKMGNVSVQGSNENNASNKDMKREIKGEIIDEMEKKINRCREAGCENKISYKFRVGGAKEEIINEVKEGNYDLIVLRSSRSSHKDSWMRSFFSDARKIISNINIPVLIVQ